MDLKELVNKINERLVEEKVSEDINNPYTVQEFSLDILDAIEGLTAVKEMMEKEDENFDEPSLKAIRTSERILECSKKFRADLLEQRAAKWESVNEDLLNDNIIKASENIGVQDMINMLLHIVESYVSEQTIKNIRNQFTLALASELNKSVNETKDVDGNIVDYNFSVTVTMDAENEVANDSLKSDIQKAIEDGLEKYDASIEVEDA